MFVCVSYTRGSKSTLMLHFEFFTKEGTFIIGIKGFPLENPAVSLFAPFPPRALFH